MSKKNIITSVVAGLALILVVVVVLVETGVIRSDFSEPETVIESEVIVVSETNEFGDVEYLTMVTRYSKPKISSNYRYPTKKTTTKKHTTTTVKYVEQTNIIELTQENGLPAFDENGVRLTEIVTYTVREDSITKPTTAAPKTSAVAVTDASGNKQTDVSGNPVTEVVSYYETTTEAPNRWTTTEEGTTAFIHIETPIKRDDALAQNIVDQINDDRKAAGLAPLEHATGLIGTARLNSAAIARGEESVASDAYTLETTYGGSAVYQTVVAANSGKAMSPDTTKIGVGVVIYEGHYYTTVIFR